MLVRSQRPQLHSNCTTEAVGPGSYAIQDPVKPSTRFSVAPFGSTSVKLPLPGSSGGGADDRPGPGAYSPVVSTAVVGIPASVKAHQSSSFSSRTSRFNPQAAVGGSVAPGPGSYDPQLLPAHNKAIVMQPPNGASGSDAHHHHSPSAGGRGGRGQQKGIDWVKVATAPSIPCGPQSFGYEEGPGGALVQQPAPYQGHDGTIRDVPAPGEYDPNICLTRPSNHVPTFGRSRSQRSNVVRSSTQPNLGPGSYNAERAKPSQLSLVSAKGAFNSKTERIFVPGGDSPGPGEYDVVGAKSAFADLKHYLATHPEEFSVFGSSQVESRGPRRDSLPGPGAYNSANPSVVIHDKGKANAVFTSSVNRFSNDGSGGNGMPGPGSYEMQSAASVAEKLARAVPNRFGGFGSTSRRFAKTKQANETQQQDADGSAAGSPSTGSAGSYRPASNNPRSPSSGFSRDSRTSAFRPPDSVIHRQSVRKQQEADQGPTWTEMRQLPDLWQKKGFSSTPSMYTSGPRLMSSTSFTPGPGAYETNRDELKKNAVGFNLDKRPPITNLSGDGPGPGSHFVPGSMLRPSFNVTFS